MMGSSNLEPQEVAALHEALDDEYKAWATYDQVLKDFGRIRPFCNIIESEARHIAALTRLFARYDVPLPPNPYPGKVPRYDSLKEACEAGVRGELENEQLYHRLLAATRRADIRDVFKRLRDASQLRHFPAFRRCALRRA
jgi:rubrerythrin